MTVMQKMVLFDMSRQGLHLFADRAKKCWDSGKVFTLDPSIAIPRILRHQLLQCNREAQNQFD